MVWDIDRQVAEDVARPIIMHNSRRRLLAALRQGVVLHSNSIYNRTRFEDVWLDK